MKPVMREKGTALLEVLIGGLLIAVAVVAVAQLVTASAVSSERNRARQLATERASYLLEEVRNKSYAAVPESGTTTASYSPPGTNLTLSETVTYVTKDANNDTVLDEKDYKVVTIVVDWSHPKPSKPVKLTTYVSEKGD